MIFDDSFLGDSIEDREVDLVIIGVEVKEELVYQVDDFLASGILLIDLVDQQDRS